jgi:flagellar hook-length control protein FliK
MKNSEQPAFPYARDIDKFPLEQGGLTKREYFAAMAMQGLVSDPETIKTSGSAKDLVEMALELSDELLKQLENENT